MSKVILITGCASPKGLGHHAAEQLKAKGHRVYATTREELDLLDEGSIIDAVAKILEKEGRIDVVINNAAAAVLGAIEQINLDEARHEFDTNYFGALRLIQEVLPTMREQNGGQILNICTVFCHHTCPPGFGVHLASKAALARAGEALAAEVAPWNIRVTNFEPGAMKTSFVRRRGHRMTAPYEGLIEKVFGWFAEKTPHFQLPEEVAKRLVEVVESDAPHLHEQSSAETQSYMSEKASDPMGESQLEEYLVYVRET